MDFIFELFARVVFKGFMQLFVWQPILKYGFTTWLIIVLALLSITIFLFFVYRYYNPRQAIEQKSKRRKR